MGWKIIDDTAHFVFITVQGGVEVCRRFKKQDCVRASWASRKEELY